MDRLLLPQHEDLDDQAIRSDAELFDEVVRVAGHYLADEPSVAAARHEMYHNLQQAGVVDDAQRHVLDSITARIGEYVNPLGLVGTTSRLLEAM